MLLSTLLTSGLLARPVRGSVLKLACGSHGEAGDLSLILTPVLAPITVASRACRSDWERSAVSCVPRTEGVTERFTRADGSTRDTGTTGSF